MSRSKDIDEWAESKFEALLIRGRRLRRSDKWIRTVELARLGFRRRDFTSWSTYIVRLREESGNWQDSEVLRDILQGFKRR